MKILLTSLLSVSVLSISPASCPNTYLEQPQEEKVVLEKIKVKPIEPLVNALIYVESRGKSDAIGDTHLGEPSIGVLQIRPIMVREVNRILKLKGVDYRYKLSDRRDSIKSVEMFLIWKEFHHKDSDFEKIARNWNGGPIGYKNSRTHSYWMKVKQQMDERQS